MMLRRYLLKGETRKVRRSVIEFKNRPYIVRVLPRHEGRAFEIRYDPNDDFEFEVYDGETWIGTAVQRERATEAQCTPPASAATTRRARADSSAAQAAGPS
jgi:hypothetical protein